MYVRSEAVDEIKAGEAPFDFEGTFRAQYGRVARVIERVIREPQRAEELAVEVFLKLWRTPRAQGEKTEGWLYRAAVRKALDELRRRNRRERYERLFGFGGKVATPEDVRAATEVRQRVRFVLGVIGRRQAEILLLRGEGLSYEELAAALELNAASIGTLLGRAQRAFRKEYFKRYGDE